MDTREAEAVSLNRDKESEQGGDSGKKTNTASAKDRSFSRLLLQMERAGLLECSGHSRSRVWFSSRRMSFMWWEGGQREKEAGNMRGIECWGLFVQMARKRPSIRTSARQTPLSERRCWSLSLLWWCAAWFAMKLNFCACVYGTASTVFLSCCVSPVMKGLGHTSTAAVGDLTCGSSCTSDLL